MIDWDKELETYKELWYLTRYMRNTMRDHQIMKSIEMDELMSYLSDQMRLIVFKKWCLEDGFQQGDERTPKILELDIEIK